MKKLLLSTFALTLMLNVNAQFTPTNIGMAANSLTNAFSPKTALWYDPNINTLTFTHRGDGTVFPSGQYIVDVSKDGGATWTVNQGPVYDNLSGLNGRYPQGVIYNPSGNTDPNNAYLMATGPTLAASNGAWGGYATGSWKLDASAAAITSENTAIPNYVGTAGGSQSFVNRNGDFWEVSQANDQVNLVLPGQVIVIHGTWNGTSYDLTNSTLDYPTTSTFGGDADIAFGPDGMTGYIVTMDILNDAGADPNTLLPCIWKTTDAGANWARLGYLNLDNLSVDFSGATPITSHTEIDIAVDMNENLHIGSIAAITDATLLWAQTANNFAVYDFFTTDGGTTWYANRVAYPAMYGGTYGTDNGGFVQSLRVQTSQTWAGDKLFITWSETDPNFDPANNIYPDMWTAGYDIASSMWTDKIDLTPAALNIYYHNVSHYVSGATGSYRMHAIYQAIADPTISLVPPQFAYLTFSGSSLITDGQFTNATSPTLLTFVPLPLGIAHNDPGLTKISNVYPNPSLEMSYLDINLEKSENTSLKITNVMGQVVSNTDLGKLNAGKNHVPVSTKNLAAGVYSVNITTASMSVVRNFVVK